MAQIVINEISQNYTYNIGSNSYATVALPITASWGPAFMDERTSGKSLEIMLEETAWNRFPATQAGLEAFVSTYRGPASCYRLAKDYSYQMAMTLLTSGYDVLVCRVCPGAMAQGILKLGGKDCVSISAKHPGTFGNNLQVVLSEVPNSEGKRWNLVTYVLDVSGIRTAVENLSFVIDPAEVTDNVLHIDELESNFLILNYHENEVLEGAADSKVTLTGGSDVEAVSESATVTDIIESATNYATIRYGEGLSGIDYGKALAKLATSSIDKMRASTIQYQEWIYSAAYRVYDLLEDKLTYNPNRVISPGWDDQNISALDGSEISKLATISPLHKKLMEVAYRSRCATAYLDIPKCLPRSGVYDESSNSSECGYAQTLARYTAPGSNYDVNESLYSTHCALFAPWGQYTYVGTSKQNDASPAFLALLIQRAMILNQPTQYEWALPTNRKHNLKIGKLAYNVPKKILDDWQKLEGVGVNVITAIPDIGTSVWGNSTLFEVPPATYQALANLSTRLLVNAVENLAYRCGISITFQYNNDQAYNTFYAGMTPLLDTMKNVGAIDDYYVKMAADINGLDRVNANTVIGKIYLVVNGVVNDIFIDLIALPPGTDLNQYRS